ncbi:hypothetical protein IG631_12598 [Alternaria alternata]|nr:hypothetical protein IG631_12598 [Alternaria alternata]
MAGERAASFIHTGAWPDCGERSGANPLQELGQMGILWQAQPRHPLLLPYYSPVHRPCFLPFRPSSLNLLNQSLLLVHLIERDSLANVIRLSRHRPPLTYCISGTLSVRLATYQSSHPPPCLVALSTPF